MSKSPSLRRNQADIRELALDPSDRYHAAPLENDMFEWHFTIRGADGTDFEGGVYHGRIMLPPEYPFKPPHIIFLTPSGRFETNTKVCLSFSAYHPELWQPAWGIRLILEALISFLPTPADGAIGALDWTSAERRKLAQKSVNYHCATCGCKAVELLPKLKPKTDDGKPTGAASSRFQKEIEKLRQLQSLEHGEEEGEKKKETTKEVEEAGEQQTTEDQRKPSLQQEKETPSTVSSGEEPKETSTEEKEATTKQDTMINGQEKEQIAKADATPPTATAEVRPGRNGSEGKVENRTDTTQTERPRIENTESRQQQQQQQQQQRVQQPIHPVQPQQAILQQQNQNAVPIEGDDMLSWMSDPVLHGITVVLATICFLLLRKLQAMMEELDELKQVLE